MIGALLHAYALVLYPRNNTKRRVLIWCYRRTLFPVRLHLYQQAMTHASATNSYANTAAKVYLNERLEYLGDAVLDLVIAELLYRNYPDFDEGMLTSMRSKIVNNRHLGQLAKQMDIHKCLNYKGRVTNKMLSNALEALLGAVYLDQGMRGIRAFVKKNILTRISLDAMQEHPLDYKGHLIQWAQQRKLVPRFENEPIVNSHHNHSGEIENNRKRGHAFQSTLYLDQLPVSVGHGSSKKQAEQQASKKAYASFANVLSTNQV